MLPLRQSIIFIFFALTLSFFSLGCTAPIKNATWTSEFFNGHPLLSPDFYLEKDEQLIHFSITNRVGDKNLKEMHLPSGNLYGKFFLCNENTYTMGIIPRLLQPGSQIRPVKVIVFGRERFYAHFQGKATHSVRFIGGLQLSTCTKDQISCLSEFIVIAIDPQDPKYHGIHHREDLIFSKQVDWPAFLKSIEQDWGVHLYQPTPTKAIRVERILDVEQVKNEIFAKKYRISNKLAIKLLKVLPLMQQNFNAKINPVGIKERKLMKKLAAKAQTHQPSYRYINVDDQTPFGTNETIQDWVEHFGAYPRCPFRDIENMNHVIEIFSSTQ